VSLKLVTDNTVELPVENVMDLPGQARHFADRLEAGDFGNVSRVLIVIDGAPLRFQYSGAGASAYELMGLLNAAQMLIFADQNDED